MTNLKNDEYAALTLWWFIVFFVYAQGGIFENIWEWFAGLFSRGDEAKGFIFDFQNLLAGILAFGAGYFVYSSTQLTLKREKEKDRETAKKYRTYYAKEAEDISYYAKAYKEYLDDTRPCKFVVSLLEEFSEKFLINKEHVIYFNENEIESISNLNGHAGFANEMIDYLRQWANNNPSTPFASKDTEMEKETMQTVYAIASELSKSLSKR